MEHIRKEEYYPHSTSQLALKLGYSWHTVQHYCFELFMRKKIDLLTAAGSHIWLKNGGFSAKKPRIENQGISDKQLAKEIDAAFEQLISNEIDLTVKELSASLRKKEQKAKQEQEVEQ